MFQGFSPETIDFLWGIRMNNNREWFQEHKEQYTKTLYEPMKALGAELFAPFAEKPGNLLKVSRIYRDARLHHPLPYKETLWACIRQDVQWWSENPCLFAQISPDCMEYGLLFWRPSSASMENFRREISAHPDEFLKLIRKTEKDTGIAVTADCYKRPKTPEDPRLAPYFAWKNGISCICREEISPALFEHSLAERIGTMFRQLSELYDYFNRFHG